jgi:hypothetical protein
MAEIRAMNRSGAQLVFRQESFVEVAETIGIAAAAACAGLLIGKLIS